VVYSSTASCASGAVIKENRVMAPIMITRVAPDRCETCGRRHKSVLTLGHAFRQREIRSGRADLG
jgi:hypothetical protein